LKAYVFRKGFASRQRRTGPQSRTIRVFACCSNQQMMTGAMKPLGLSVFRHSNGGGALISEDIRADAHVHIHNHPIGLGLGLRLLYGHVINRGYGLQVMFLYIRRELVVGFR